VSIGRPSPPIEPPPEPPLTGEAQEDGSIVLVVAADTDEDPDAEPSRPALAIPAPPAEGEWTVRAVNGDVTWVPVPPPTTTATPTLVAKTGTQ
jgi:hypothetical protein